MKKKLGGFNLNSELNDEKFICLTGKNGSGKSSLLNIIAGIYKPDEGYIKINSVPVTDVSPEKRQVVLITPESCLPSLTVSKHLLWGAKLRKKRVSDDLITEVRKLFGIGYEGKVSKLSLGMKERVSLATALLAEPKVILVDEAFGNLDNRGEFIKAYRDYAKRSSTDVVFSTQHIEDSQSADHHYSIDRGTTTRLF